MMLDTLSNVSHKTKQLPCVHCNLPTHVSADIDPDDVFCCSGCRGAYDLINGWGLSEFYKLRDQIGGEQASAISSHSRFDHFDSEQFLGASSPKPTSDGFVTSTLAIHGLHCGACVWLLESAAQRYNGLQFVRVKMSDHTARIVYDPNETRLSQVARLFDQLGYELAPLTTERDEQSRRENKRLLMQIAIAGFCAANAMWIAIALYAGEATGVARSQWLFLRFIGTGLGVASVVGPGRTFFRGAIASVRTRTPHMDLPVALGLSVGTVVGVVHVLAEQGAVYFDSLAVLVFLLLIGRWIQFHQQQRAARNVDLLLRITPRHANRIQTPEIAGTELTELVLVDTLRVGDLIRVAPGESIPVDGRIVTGNTTLDRSLLTGESKRVPAQTNDLVEAGTINIARPIQVQVEAIGQESRIGRVMQTVSDAALDKPAIVQLADRIGGVFVCVVTLLAILTFAYWFSTGWVFAAENATSLLIVACPCALALATPLAIAVAIGKAAQSRIMIRDGGSLQQLSRPGTLWFDKTGTLTEGNTRVVELVGSVDGLRHAAAVEQHCCHPIADGIVDEAKRLALEIPTDSELKSATMGGVFGVSEGLEVCVGTPALMRSRGVIVDEEFVQSASSCTRRGISPILIAIEGHVATVVGIADPLKPDASDAVGKLTREGWRVGILSGDQQATVSQVALDVGIDAENALGDLSPEDKLSMVRRERGKETVVMVGDGANDAAALAAADVGIAVRGGADVSLQAAPVFVATGNLSGIIDLMAGSIRTTKLIHRTFAVSLGYNLIAVVLAATGLITPLLAAILMPISSVSVLILTLASTTFPKASP